MIFNSYSTRVISLLMYEKYINFSHKYNFKISKHRLKNRVRIALKMSKYSLKKRVNILSFRLSFFNKKRKYVRLGKKKIRVFLDYLINTRIYTIGKIYLIPYMHNFMLKYILRVRVMFSAP